MKVQPRKHLLDIWRATAAASFQKGDWQFGGREESNSITDAEQLLCLMTPANEIRKFRLGRPNEIDPEVLEALKQLGDRTRLPRLLIRVLTDYHERYRADGVPVFSGGSFFVAPEGGAVTEQQRSLDIVESFSSSVTLTLATLAFARTFAQQVTRPELTKDIEKLEALASERLTAALVGLLRSFSILVFSEDDIDGTTLISSINQTGAAPHKVAETLRADLREIRAGLLDLSTGSGTDPDTKEKLGDPLSLFQCGWSWGLVDNAPTVGFIPSAGGQGDGVALDAPYLYFTGVALDGIADLFSVRTRTLNLLDDDQQRLARALQIRYDLTQAYWAVLASFGPGKWPLEDIPWRSIDGAQSDYFTLMVAAIAMNDLVTQRAADTDLGRLGNVLSELANRGRVTRRPIPGDPALVLHEPGVTIPLEGTEKVGDHQLVWEAADFSPLLLKRTIRIADLLKEIPLRVQLLRLAGDIWEHLLERRFTNGPGQGLWDNPQAAFPSLTKQDSAPSWHHTVRVVESLVHAAKLVDSHPLASPRLAEIAEDLLSEAEHLFDQQLLIGDSNAGQPMQRKLAVLRSDLDRAAVIIAQRPGTAVVLIDGVLRELDRLAIARQDAVEGT
ncbi:MAG: hypothetical protein HOV79_13935 [Hamadaea sp.]|nr:hypothetical protein [Hamadaea sp.]